MGRGLATKSLAVSLVGASLLVTACDDGPFGPGWDGALIQTDQTTYSAEPIGIRGSHQRYGFTLVAQFTNVTRDVLYLSRCGPDAPIPTYGVELLGDAEGHEVAAYTHGWACVGHDRQFRLEPGEFRVDTLEIYGPHSWDGVTGEPRGVAEGRFRLRYGVKYCPGVDCRDEAPESFGMSNEFRVTLADQAPRHP